LNQNVEVSAVRIARALDCHQSHIPRRVLTGELPAPARRLCPTGFRWNLSDIRQLDPALAARIEADFALNPVIGIRAYAAFRRFRTGSSVISSVRVSPQVSR
jgi:hypothetical protein